VEAIVKDLGPYIESTELPQGLVEKIKDLKIDGCLSRAPEHGAIGCNFLEGNALFFEIAKQDICLQGFIGVHWGLGTEVIEFCGNEEQKNRMLSDCIKFNKISAFALSEPKFGSDATSLETFAVKATDGRDGWILNGQKRWIGHATIADYIVVWAKNKEEGNKIQGFVVEKGSEGLKTEKIKGKYSLRML
jgi:alkylation response protein AidB-like acyl-CoA dehydrogenase